MYFESRIAAGMKLAEQLQGYRYENTVIVALTDGAVRIGMQIAAEIHATLTMLLTESIEVPGEGQLFGTVNQNGQFIHSTGFSDAQFEEYYSEFHGYLEEQKREKVSGMNRLVGMGGIVDESMLREQNVILLSDGLTNGSILDVAIEFLKPLRVLRVIIAAPIADVSAVDRAHLLGDELHILGVTDNYFDTDHYYEVNDTPNREQVLQELNDFIMNWR